MLCAARIGLDRSAIEFAALLGGNRPALRERWQERSARRLVATLGALKGTFAKAAQFAAIRHDLLPASLTVPLAELRDRVPPLPFRWIRAMVEAELGQPLDSLFASFSPEPFGAASIAQVHRARLPCGTTVAVKVQYPWLDSSVSADMAIARAGLFIFRAMTGRSAVNFDQILSEFEIGFRSELDFVHEAAVADEIRANLSGDDGVAVPRVHPSHSSRRILTMEYFSTVRVDDTAGLRRLGVDPTAVLESIGRAYAKQVFVDGLFHADPHPGNLFVIDEPAATTHPRVLFVDFGLSQRLDPKLRRELRQGIYALLKNDLDAFLSGMERMEMIEPGARPAVERAVSSMFERIRRERGGAMTMSTDRVLALKDEASALLFETPGLSLPLPLLFYAKTLSYVFSLGRELAPEVDLMKLAVPHLLRFLAEQE